MPKTLKDFKEQCQLQAWYAADHECGGKDRGVCGLCDTKADSLAKAFQPFLGDTLLQSSEGLHEKKDHCAGLAAVGNDTGRSTTEAASDVVTVSREAAEDALQYAWNAGVAGAWKCVREMFADGRDVRGWAISVEKHSAPVAANWQQARDLLFGSASSSPSEASGHNAQERSAEKP
jgi:hypothetical protein